MYFASAERLPPAAASAALRACERRVQVERVERVDDRAGDDRRV
jgi:hypothetical protein